MTAISRRGTRVAIVDDHVLFAESMVITLEMEGYSVRRVPLPETGSLAAVLAGLVRSLPRIVLLDLDLGRLGDGVRMIEPLSSVGCAVIVVTGASHQARWGECLRRGAVKVLVKTAPLNEVVAAVRRVHDGLPLMARDERQRLIETARVEHAENGEVRARLGLLTRREQEILSELMHGHQVRQIATASVVSEATVRTQVKSILAKLETGSQLSAVGAAYSVGWRLPSD